MGSRLDLQTELEAVLGSRNVYFQPPETLKIKYPAIIYKLSGIETVNADNIKYLLKNRYTVTLVHNDPDNETKDYLLTNFPYISFDTSFESDNLYHYVYDLFY